MIGRLFKGDIPVSCGESLLSLIGKHDGTGRVTFSASVENGRIVCEVWTVVCPRDVSILNPETGERIIRGMYRTCDLDAAMRNLQLKEVPLGKEK